MKFNCLSLQPIYDAISAAHGNPQSPPQLPPRKSLSYQEYRRAYKHLIRGVNGDRAVYLWFAVRKNKEPEFIYVGQSNKNRGELRQRFDDEFRQWYHIFWMTAFKTKRYAQEVKYLYPGYDTEIENASLKHGATHLAFCTDIPPAVNIETLEKEVIALFDFPRGNDDEEGFMKPSRYSNEAKTIQAEFIRIIQNTT